jgi:pimeloyl-ACP methyl ester carboxylesterase
MLRAHIHTLRGAFVSTTSRTSAGIAYDRAGPRGDLPVVLLHAGVADRRMWDPLWPALTAERDVVRLDLRGFGESVGRPSGALYPVGDVVHTLAELSIDRYHLVGASFGAGVAIEVTLGQPERVASLLLIAPGGSLIAEVTPDLRTFIEAEGAALARKDRDSAVEANLAWWVEGPQRIAGDVDPTMRDLVRRMQRRAFEVTAGWDGVEERELDPPALDRLAEIRVPTLVLVGALDLQAVHDAHGGWLSALPARGASTGRAPPTCPRWNAPRTSSRCCATGCPGDHRTRRDASMRTTR